jgi:hypothetical protein
MERHLNTSYESEINEWINASTRGIPHDQRVWVREELLDHYADAVRDHLLRGVSALDAHRAALAALGSSDETRRGLQMIHNAPQKYRFAMLAAPVVPLLLLAHFGGISLHGAGISVYFYYAASLLTILYILNALGTLLLLTHNINIDRQTFAIALGLSAVNLAPMFAAILDHVAVDLGIVEMTASGTWGCNLLMFIWVGGSVIMGMGLVWLATAVLNLSTARWDGKLLRWLAIFFVLNGYAVVFSNVSSVVNLFTLGWIAEFVVLICCTITHALFTYIFFRAAAHRGIYGNPAIYS